MKTPRSRAPTALDAMAAAGGSSTPGRPSRAALTLLRNIVAPVVRVAFRPTLEGLEHVPRVGPFLLVANHSGALGAAEIFSFASLYIAHFGTDRPLAGFAHPFGFRVFLLRRVLRGLGAVPSTYEAGEAALAAGVGLLVFPGGDYEVARPIWQARRVDFNGRQGFLKLAQRAHVPILPMGIRGAHFTAPILWRSELVLPHLFVLPRVLGLKRYPLTFLAVLGAMVLVVALPSLGPWRWLLAGVWLTSPLALIPWVPWSIRIRIGESISPEELFGSQRDLGEALARVEGAVRDLTAR